jgi:outer membrane immunogenic protein
MGKVRMKLGRATALAAVMASGAMPALAGGLAEAFTEPTVAPAPAAVLAPAAVAAANANWSGFYIGGQLGNVDLVASDKTFNGTSSTKGLLAGYRADLGKIVVGIEGNYDMTDLNLNAGAVIVDNVARLKLIGGYDLGPALLYATVAAVRADSSIGSDNGTAMGLGVDYALTGRVTVGAELLEHRFKDFAGSGINLDATTFNLRVGFRF